MKFTDLRVKTKLMLGFAAVAAIVLLVSALSLRSLGASNDRFSSYLAGVGARERLATDIHEAAARQVQELNDISANIHTSGVQYTSTDEDQSSTLSSAMNL